MYVGISEAYVCLAVFSFCTGEWVCICVRVPPYICALRGHRSVLGSIHLVALRWGLSQRPDIPRVAQQQASGIVCPHFSQHWGLARQWALDVMAFTSSTLLSGILAQLSVVLILKDCGYEAKNIFCLFCLFAFSLTLMHSFNVFGIFCSSSKLRNSLLLFVNSWFMKLLFVQF